ncbi:ac116 [Troides aeacus nucleopolyhedrovirus]|nr:ac116 [Troides aeacus nucleopolyhedrovirus]
MYFTFRFLSALGTSNTLAVRCMMVKMNAVDAELYRHRFIFCATSHFVRHTTLFTFS